eukprot:4729220-Heterocapsa_arctica.AAC.1
MLPARCTLVSLKTWSLISSLMDAVIPSSSAARTHEVQVTQLPRFPLCQARRKPKASQTNVILQNARSRAAGRPIKASSGSSTYTLVLTSAGLHMDCVMRAESAMTRANSSGAPRDPCAALWKTNTLPLSRHANQGRSSGLIGMFQKASLMSRTTNSRQPSDPAVAAPACSSRPSQTASSTLGRKERSEFVETDETPEALQSRRTRFLKVPSGLSFLRIMSLLKRILPPTCAAADSKSSNMRTKSLEQYFCM